MQSVPFTSFTTKSIEYGNPVNPVQTRSYGICNQDRQLAFAPTFQRAVRELSGQSNENHASTDTELPVSLAATGSVMQLDTLPDSEETSSLMLQLLEILQMLGFAGGIELTGRTQDCQAGCQPQTGNQAQNGMQTPTMAMLIKAFTGQNGNHQEILGQLQENLQQLSLKFNGNSTVSNQGNEMLVAIQKELLAALQMADGDVLKNQDFLIKLAEVVAKIANKPVTAGENLNPYILTVSKAGEADQNLVRSQTAQNPPAAGDHNLGVRAEVSNGNPTGEGDRSTPSQVAGNDQNGNENGAGTAAKVSGQVEAKPTEAKQVEAKPTEAKQVEAKPTEAKQVEVKPTEAKQVEVKPTEAKQVEAKPTEAKQVEAKPIEAVKGTEQISVNSSGGQNEFRLQDQNNASIQNNVDFTQVQSSKVTEPPVNIPRMAQVIFGQIAQQAKLLVTPGTTEMQIQLKPDFLGKMNLSITSENGLVTAKFSTESYRVKEVIEANLNILKDSLTQQGVKVDQLVVSVSTQKDYSGYQEQNHSYYYQNSGNNKKTGEILNEEGFEKFFSADLESRNIQAYYGNTIDFKA